MNMPKDMASFMRDKFSRQWLSGPGSPLGPSGILTAYGTFHAMKQALKFKTGSGSFSGISVAVQGLGEVGMKVAELLAQEGARLIITNRNMNKVEELTSKYPNGDIKVVPEGDILNTEADIFSPNAIGGIITEDNIPNLKFKIIIGGANNQLNATSVEEEIRLAKMLARHDILFQVDFWHNCGGVIVAFDEYELWTATTTDAVIAKVVERVSRLTWEKLNEAKEKGITPTEAIYDECLRIIYGEGCNQIQCGI
jgi:glutamate dehydrogenase/leucine dehydrogenase